MREKNEQPAKGLFPELALISDCNQPLFLIRALQRGGVAEREEGLRVSGRLDDAECIRDLPRSKFMRCTFPLQTNSTIIQQQPLI